MPHTPGPWKWEPFAEGSCEPCLVGGDGTEIIYRGRNEDGDDVLIVNPADAPLIAQAPAMYELLKEIEWTTVDSNDGDFDICPSCKSLECFGHALDCRLAAVLKAVEGEENARTKHIP